MSQVNSKTLEAEIEKIQGEADRFIGNLEIRLNELKSTPISSDIHKRYMDEEQTTVKAEIERARAMYGGILDPKRKQMEQVRAAEAAEAIQNLEAIETRAAATKEEIRSELRLNWVNSGGSLDMFDAIFEEQLYPAEMIRRAGKVNAPDKAEEDRSRRRQKSIVTDGMNRF